MSAEQSKASQDAEKELTRLWRAWRTVKEMCADRVSNETLMTSFPEQYTLKSRSRRATSLPKRKSASLSTSFGRITRMPAAALSMRFLIPPTIHQMLIKLRTVKQPQENELLRPPHHFYAQEIHPLAYTLCPCSRPRHRHHLGGIQHRCFDRHKANARLRPPHR